MSEPNETTEATETTVKSWDEDLAEAAREIAFDISLDDVGVPLTAISAVLDKHPEIRPDAEGGWANLEGHFTHTLTDQLAAQILPMLEHDLKSMIRRATMLAIRQKGAQL